jgi:integrase
MPIHKIKGVKKDGLQKYHVRVNYLDDNGVKKQLTRTAWGLESAKDLERQLTSGIKNKSESPVRKMTVQELFDEFIAVKQYEVRESTLGIHKQNYRLYVQPTLANVRIDKLNASMLQEWKVSIEQKGLSLETKNHAYSILRAVLNYALKMEYLAKNPLANVGNFKDALHTKKEMRFYTPQDFTGYIRTVKQLAQERQTKHRDLSEWDFYVFFNIAFYTGLRKGEIHALKWSDLDGAYLSVRRSIAQKMKGGDRETPPKNKSSIRTLQMPLPLIQVLKEQRERQEQTGCFAENNRICGGERCLRDSTVQKRNERYAELSGLDIIRIHDFRHSHVSVLANEGINIQEIARRLGHSKIEETRNTYAHLYPREEEKAVNVLNTIA